jgi:acylglycerol lipase
LSYYYIAIKLALLGYGVFGIDHASFGKSECSNKKTRRGIIPDFNILVEDFVEFCNLIKKEYTSVPFYILAHSMGTLVAILAIKNLTEISGILFSGAALVSGPAASSPFGVNCLYPLSQTSFANMLLFVTSRLDPCGSAAPVIESEVTGNLEYLELMKKDVRRCKAIVPNKTAYEILKMNALAKKSLTNISVPFICLHGSEDKVTLNKGSELLFNNASTDASLKQLKIVHGSRHEIFNEVEPNRTEAVNYAIEFFESLNNNNNNINNKNDNNDAGDTNLKTTFNENE